MSGKGKGAASGMLNPSAGRKRSVVERDQSNKHSKSSKRSAPKAAVAPPAPESELTKATIYSSVPADVARGVFIGNETEDVLQQHADDLSSDDEIPKNTIGNVPLEWYKDYGHIGYDVTGKAITRKSKGDGIDAFLKAQDDPIGHKWRIYDEENDEEIILSKRDVQILRNITQGTYGHPGFDPTSEDYNLTDIYSRDVEPMPLNDDAEPKRRFVPSKWEMKKVMRIVKAIREGRYHKDQPTKKKPDIFLLWGEDDNVIGHDPRKNAPPPIPAPKLPPPGHAASYNPPAEYLLTDEEKKAWEEADPSDRQMQFLPQKFSCLRHVPLYAQGIRERFERCLDLYLCPRAMREKLQVDPDSLLPKLPDPSELRPFPTTSAFQFRGHKSRVRSISVDPSGQWLVSGSDDKTIKLWEISSGRCVRTWELDSVPQSLAWCPNAAVAVVAIAVDNKLLFLYAGTATPVNAESTFDALRGWRAEAAATEAVADKKPRNVVTVDDESKTAAADENDSSDEEGDEESPAAGADTTGIPVRTAQWHTDVEHTGNSFPSTHTELLPRLGAVFSTGVKVAVLLSSAVKRVVWHRKGDYIATVCPNAPSGAVMIHQLSKRSSNCPFKKNHGQVQTVAFHPTQPHFLVANQRTVRVYDLVKEALLKKLEPGVKWISTVDMHPSGDHLVVGSYDHRTVWFDTELSDRPYKTLRYHTKAVRRTAFHSLYPLMATASDDGSVHVFHAKVFNDFVQNPLIIPVKILRGHSVTDDGLGVLDCAFHPLHPWLITAGADHNIQLWHNLP